MNIHGMAFQTDNAFGGKVSKFELAINRVMMNAGKRDYLTVREFATMARVSVVSAYRYWAHIEQNYYGSVTDLEGREIFAITYSGRQMFVVVKGGA